MKPCECGCGQPAPIATQTNGAYGHVKGQPMRFVLGHATRKRGVADLWVPNDDGCWIWQLTLTDGGYGTKLVGGRVVKAHRWTYEQRHGPVPEGFVLDHLCYQRACVNPEHLEVVTQVENLRRGRARRTRAIEYLMGDEFTEAVGREEAQRVRRQIAGL